MKIDNQDPTAKLDLRRYFLRKYHADDPPSVLDCCQGDGVLWTELRKEFTLANYWGIDVKAKKGRVKIDSVRILTQPGWPQNVIDVDTSGSPWKHWNALLPNVVRPLTVFLTVGQNAIGKNDLTPLTFMGFGKLAAKVPAGFHLLLRSMYLPYAFEYAKQCGVKVVEAVEAEHAGRVRFIGVRIAPAAKRGRKRVAKTA